MNQAATAPADGLKSDSVSFAHASERQFARLLDFYQIDWAYEPRSFDLEWDRGTMRYGQIVQRRFRKYETCPHLTLWVCQTDVRRDGLRGRADISAARM